MYNVVVYWNDVFPIMIGQFKTLKEARAKAKDKEVLKVVKIVKIYHNGEEVKWQNNNLMIYI